MIKREGWRWRRNGAAKEQGEKKGVHAKKQREGGSLVVERRYKKAHRSI